MRALIFLLSLVAFLYGKYAYSTLYSCDVFKDKEKITTLTGSLNNSDTARLGANSQQADPNMALAFLLCQQAGLKPVNVMMDVTGIRNTTSVRKNQYLPNPSCSLKCSPL